MAFKKGNRVIDEVWAKATSKKICRKRCGFEEEGASQHRMARDQIRSEVTAHSFYKTLVVRQLMIHSSYQGQPSFFFF